MCLHPFILASNNRIPLIAKALFTATYNARTPYDCRQEGWNHLSRILRPIIRVKMSGADSPYSDFQVMEESYMRGAQ